MELNREQVKKALECCTSYCDKDNCPYKTHDIPVVCMTMRMVDALALINSQEQRVKELTEQNEGLRADKDYWKNRAKESESEYDQAVKRGYNLGTVDAVRSFAERLKAETITIQDHTGKLGLVVLVGTIDQIAKEMLEGENEN